MQFAGHAKWHAGRLIFNPFIDPEGHSKYSGNDNLSGASSMNMEEQIPTQEPEIAGGTYEILRKRLLYAGKALENRLQTLDDERKKVFGAIPFALTNNARLATENNCIARDIARVNEFVIFGYNVHLGLRKTTAVKDVFSVFRFEGSEITEQHPELLDDPQFTEDFVNLYQYYRATEFIRFFRKGPFLYMVFNIGANRPEYKAFKWIIETDAIRYIDNRSIHEVQMPPQHEFKWTKAGRDDQVTGTHPHVNILDRVFVETIGGDLTIKVENNTDSGKGILEEPVEHTDQTLDDAEYWYASVGNLILLKIKPFQEKDFRYFIFNEKLKEARRIDSIGEACILLPDDQGIIFPNGYYLQTGEYKVFEQQIDNLEYDGRIISPNGEDFLYVFHQSFSGEYLLLSWNMIAQQLETPLLCHGYTLFEDGRMAVFLAEEEPRKTHVVQLWTTPFTKDEQVSIEQKDHFLFKLGNREIVKAMAGCREILTLIHKDEQYEDLFLDISRSAQDQLDMFFWLSNEQGGNLAEPLKTIRDTANQAISEFEKVQSIRKETRSRTAEVRAEAEQAIASSKRIHFQSIDQYVEVLAGLRTIRGKIISLKELRYHDEELIAKLDKEVADRAGSVAERCAVFLADESSMQPYQDKIAKLGDEIGKVETVQQVKSCEETSDKIASELEMLTGMVNDLPLEDSLKKTKIIEMITGVYSKLNQLRAQLKKAKGELTSLETRAEFQAQMALLGQALTSFLDLSDSPEKADEYLGRIMIQVEEIEGRFADHEEFLPILAEKRNEIYEAFENRRNALTEALTRKSEALFSAGKRILDGIKKRLARFENQDDMNAWFLSDPMIRKIRDIISQLLELDETVKAEDLEFQIKAAKKEAVRSLKDKQELYSGGGETIHFGKHQFLVNARFPELAMVMQDDELFLHLTGTGFYQKVEDESLNAHKEIWDQHYFSENRNVCRAEYLAWTVYQAHHEGWKGGFPEDAVLEKLIAAAIAAAHDGGYEKGIHDADALKILKDLAALAAKAGLLRYAAQVRSHARMAWLHAGDADRKEKLQRRLSGSGIIREIFPDVKQEQEEKALHQLIDELNWEVFTGADQAQAAAFLTDVIRQGGKFPVSREAAELTEAFKSFLRNSPAEKRFKISLDALDKDPEGAFKLLCSWLEAFCASGAKHDGDFVSEAASLLLHPQQGDDPAAFYLHASIENMYSAHPSIQNGIYHLKLSPFLEKMQAYDAYVVTEWHRLREKKRQIIDTWREKLNLKSLRPEVMSAFVRNRLIDKAYLPLIGANMAKQMGAAGEQKRTDLMGMLLLISPPGYGKTTLMEYVASRLGLMFFKINGPALGHSVTSLDPAQAPDLSAREELEKLNFAFETGNNVMLYVDDIQHCHAEFLQKFISLCDAQRKVEGVWQGKAKTYDLRGKKFCVIMAGNPYTESGQKFKIPDMLANRADIYNLGDVSRMHEDEFRLSYIENAMTSNPVLLELANKSHKDLFPMIRMAEGREVAAGDFEADHSPAEVENYVNVLKKVLVLRDVVLRVNQEYIYSAGQEEDYRTEPPFRLQGSYRNMNKIAEKLSPVMNEEELNDVILSHYENESQTLTSGAEANFLKFLHLTELADEKDSLRWTEICETFRKNRNLKGLGGDRMAQVIAQMAAFNDSLDGIREWLEGRKSLKGKGDDKAAGFETGYGKDE